MRDVRTALWNGYLLQEVLCAPYLRPEDSLIHSSAYSHVLYQNLFPHLLKESQHICYPLLHWFSADQARTWRGSCGRKPRVIGYVGRLTDDKNFPQALDLLAKLRQSQPSAFKLQAVGEGRGPLGHPLVMKRLGGNLSGYEWVPTANRDQIWSHYTQFDILFFPSTSTLETFGRVLVEASYVGVPILAATHGAAPELLEPDALLPTTYQADVPFSVHLAAPLGQVDIVKAADLLQSGQFIPKSTGHTLYEGDDKRFLAIVRHGNEAGCLSSQRCPKISQTRFISRIQMNELALSPNINTDAVLQKLCTKFVALHRRDHISYGLALLELLAHSRYLSKTWEFVRRSIVKGEDFTNIGGIDLQFSHLLQLYPWFRLISEASTQDKNTQEETPCLDQSQS
ncbi:glycosyltransferase [Nostoc sp. CHAB 5784]|uniref:glycosyltransferase n=1 Tax=Nostoc mirabile TaxID=2907820 RepID=UPI001E50351F|nr:glycosyltransferase [Nostoc mirabile]MCC5669494.1 glycosyltransferase [Nostoc mirabile CHAB5784]